MDGFKSKLAVSLVLISGLIIGSFIGSLAQNVSFLTWLNYGKTIGLTQPLVLDLSFLYIQFGATISFTIAGILGMVIAGILYKVTLK